MKRQVKRVLRILDQKACAWLTEEKAMNILGFGFLFIILGALALVGGIERSIIPLPFGW